MNAQPAPIESAVAVFRRRLVTLAADPRAKLWPQAATIIRELIAALDELGQVSDSQAILLTRLQGLEGSVASLVRLDGGRDCDS